MNNQNLTIGSHIKVSRGFYTHHGIYCGDEQVVHYSGFAQAFNKGGIDLTSLDAFLGDATDFQIVNYPSYEVQYIGQEVVNRAYSRIGEDDYNLIFNNCEGFACWCITGKNKSEQVNSVMRNSTATLVSYNLLRSASTSVLLEASKCMTTATMVDSFIPLATTSSVANSVAGAAVGASTGALTSVALTSGAVGAVGLVATATAPISVPVIAIGAALGALFSSW